MPKLSLSKLDDVEICNQFKTTNNEKYYREMLKRYRPFVNSRVSRYYYGYREICNLLSYDDRDVYSEILMCLKKAMIYVDQDKCYDRKGFSFAYFVNQYCLQRFEDLGKYVRAKRRVQQTPCSYVFFTSRKFGQSECPVEDQLFGGDENIKQFYEALTSQERYYLEEIIKRETKKGPLTRILKQAKEYLGAKYAEHCKAVGMVFEKKIESDSAKENSEKEQDQFSLFGKN